MEIFLQKKLWLGDSSWTGRTVFRDETWAGGDQAARPGYEPTTRSCKRQNSKIVRGNISNEWAVVVAQLAEQLLPTPENRGSNPVNRNFLYWMFIVNCVEKTTIKKREAGNGPFLNISKELL